MTTHVTAAGDGVISVEREDETLTGLSAGIPTNSFTIRKLTTRRREGGWLFRNGEVTPWPSRGLMEHDGLIYVTGPHVNGIFLENALRDTSRNRVVDLIAVANAIAAVEESGSTLGTLHTRSMLILDDGGVLVLPVEISQAIAEHLDLAGKLRILEPYTHPDKAAPTNVGFFLAATSYLVLTGHLPFDGDSTEEIHARVRAGRPVSARHRRYAIRPEIAAFLEATLSGSRYEPSSKVWADKLLEWERLGIDSELSREALEQVKSEAVAEIDKIDRSFKRRETVRRNWQRWLIIAALIVVIGVVPGTIIRNALKPRVTAGFSPEEVVTAFYTSITTLDHMTMEDAVVDGAGRDLVREVTNLFVIDRQRMSVEMRSGFADAQLWRDEGMPALGSDVLPYGVANLSLEPIAAPEGETAFRVQYERWIPLQQDPLEIDPAAPRFEGYLITEEVRLRTDRDDWVIYGFNTLSREQLDLQALRLAQ